MDELWIMKGRLYQKNLDLLKLYKQQQEKPKYDRILIEHEEMTVQSTVHGKLEDKSFLQYTITFILDNTCVPKIVKYRREKVETSLDSNRNANRWLKQNQRKVIKRTISVRTKKVGTRRKRRRSNYLQTIEKSPNGVEKIIRNVNRKRKLVYMGFPRCRQKQNCFQKLLNQNKPMKQVYHP